MRRLVRLFSICVLAGLFLALPSSGAASAPKTVNPQAPAGPQIVAPPTLIPGARMGSLGISDLMTWAGSSGATIIVGNEGTACTGGGYFEYSSSGSLMVPVPLPAGATLWQVDVYGCAKDTSTMQFELFDLDAATGTWAEPTYANTPAGPGMLHLTFSFGSGLTLANGHEWFVTVPSTSANVGFVGAVYQYTLPSLQLYPITPVRVFDSRFARFGGAIGNGGSRLVNVKDSINVSTGNVAVTNAIPQGAKAISFTLTVAGTVGAGYLAILPGTTTTVTASTVNWSASGQILAAGGIVQLGSGSAERQVTLVAGGLAGSSTQAILDITGYYE